MQCVYMQFTVYRQCIVCIHSVVCTQCTVGKQFMQCTPCMQCNVYIHSTVCMQCTVYRQ